MVFLSWFAEAFYIDITAELVAIEGREMQQINSNTTMNLYSSKTIRQSFRQKSAKMVWVPKHHFIRELLKETLEEVLYLREAI